jgi:hypothetical protein
MADYHPLIARAVAGLPKNTGEERRALYERARQALVTQLRSVQPALEESEITRERLALEEAIRKVEAESARQAREAARPAIRRPEISRREEAPRPPPAPRPQPASPPPRPPANRPTLQDEAQKTFRETAANPNLATEARRSDQFRFEPQPQHPSPTHPLPPAPSPPTPPPPEPAAPEPNALEEYGQLEPQVQSDNLWALPLDSTPAPATPVDLDTPRPHAMPPEEEEPEPLPRRRPPRSYAGLIRTVLAVVLVAAVAGLLYWKWTPIKNVATSVIALVKPTGAPPPREAPAPARPKISDRLGQPSPARSAGPAVAQRVVLYEEDPDDPQGKRYTGTVLWKTEQKPASPGRAPEIAVRADIEIPDRQMSVTWSLRRNSDQSLPASHTIEIVFNMPADSPSGGVQNVPGVLMKQAEQTRGVPLAGLAVKVTPGYFLIGLSALESDVQRNIQLLKERSWFDIPVVYNNNRRAILAMEKGEPGERAFNEAFAAWKQ